MSNKLPPKILVIEPDETLNVGICNMIERSWFDVIRATNENDAISAASISLPNVGIIGCKLLTLQATELAQKLREIGGLENLPIIFIIDAGKINDYHSLKNNELIEFIWRPLTTHQLMTSIKSLLRKSQPIFQDKIIRYKNISMDLSRYKVFHEDKKIHLGPTEFKILQLFIQSPKTILSRQYIINNVWGHGKEIEYRTVDVHVNRLRTLMRLNKNDLHLIQTVRSKGYCLKLPGELE